MLLFIMLVYILLFAQLVSWIWILFVFKLKRKKCYVLCAAGEVLYSAKSGKGVLSDDKVLVSQRLLFSKWNHFPLGYVQLGNVLYVHVLSRIFTRKVFCVM